MDQLSQIVKDTVFWYTGGGFDLRTYPVLNESLGIYAVNMFRAPKNQPVKTSVIVQARIDGDYVIVEEDTTDRPLVDALVQAGIPREKIVLAYAGETVEPVSEV
jgi:hypothetical protein